MTVWTLKVNTEYVKYTLTVLNNGKTRMSLFHADVNLICFGNQHKFSGQS